MIRKIIFKTRTIIVRMLNDKIDLPWNVEIGRGVFIQTVNGGRMRIGSGVSIGDCCRIISSEGIVEIGDNVFIGHGVTIVAQHSVVIGSDTQIAEYVTIRDQDHDWTSSGIIRTSGFLKSPVVIGRDVWVGAKATVLRGTQIGAHAVIGANALVKGNVPERTIAAGVPARTIGMRAGAPPNG